MSPIPVTTILPTIGRIVWCFIRPTLASSSPELQEPLPGIVLQVPKPIDGEHPMIHVRRFGWPDLTMFARIYDPGLGAQSDDETWCEWMPFQRSYPLVPSQTPALEPGAPLRAGSAGSSAAGADPNQLAGRKETLESSAVHPTGRG